MDEHLLITAVASHRSLYDPTHRRYKDVELRNAIWQQIAEDLEMEVETCKAKWRTLRDGFTRALRHQKEAKNVFPPRAKKPWRYQTEMEFLVPFIYSRESRSSHSEQATEREVDDISAKANSPSDDFESDVLMDNDETQSVSSNTGTEPPVLLPVTLVNTTQNSSTLKRQSEPVDSKEVLDYLSCKVKKQELDVLLKERELHSPKPAHCQCRCPTDDPTEAFFFSMGQSVKRLPFYLQAQVKMKVCQLVTDAEMECLESASLR